MFNVVFSRFILTEKRIAVETSIQQSKEFKYYLSEIILRKINQETKFKTTFVKLCD